VNATEERPVPRASAAALLLALLCGVSTAAAEEFQLSEVRTLDASGTVKPHVIAFTDHRNDALADPATGLVTFDDWARTSPLQKQFLSLYPAYVEPTVNVTADGVTKPAKEKLHIYEAEARFTLPKTASSIDLMHYATLSFLEQLDPAITQRLLPVGEAKQASNRNPERQWCDPGASVACIQSKYQFEGKLPSGIHLANHLADSKRKIPDYLDFQSELQILPTASLDQADLAKLTGLGALVTGVLAQNIFYVNQVLQFGKVLVVFQRDPANADQTIVTGFIVLAIKTHVLESKKKYQNVPVLRNLVPAQVLAGRSSFNTGKSISAGLPVYGRNEIKALATFLAQE
jgi:hypothetical protein